MPQMAPILWVNLFIMFIVVYVIFIIMNYFSTTPLKLEKEEAKTFISDKTWKW